MVTWTLAVLLTGAMVGFGFAHLLRAAGWEPDLRLSFALLLGGVGIGVLTLARIVVST